jgi:catechol 2,3-dioxygenase-like lactoylglutathione lyase family enzyme
MIVMRAYRIGIALLLVALAAGLGPPLAPSRASSPTERAVVEAVDGVGVTVQDMERAVAFYTKVLFFERVSDVLVSQGPYGQLLGVAGARVRVVRLRLGDEFIELTEYVAPRGRPVPADSRSNDRWFQHIAIIVNDMDQVYLWLRRHRVEHVSPAPQRLPDWNANAGGIRAFYFKDPDGHPLEILEFPPDKGDPKWRRPSDRVFLGIDHTAIVVGDTDASLRFYRDTLGMRVVGQGENWGLEQERLNNVSGARLRITTLRAAAGPGIELLEYLAPRDGRPLPADTRANDLVHWQTLLRIDDGSERPRALLDGRALLVSPGVVATPDAVLGFRAGILARDPDGHAAQFRVRELPR